MKKINKVLNVTLSITLLICCLFTVSSYAVNRGQKTVSFAGKAYNYSGLQYQNLDSGNVTTVTGALTNTNSGQTKFTTFSGVNVRAYIEMYDKNGVNKTYASNWNSTGSAIAPLNVSFYKPKYVLHRGETTNDPIYGGNAEYYLITTSY